MASRTVPRDLDPSLPELADILSPDAVARRFRVAGSTLEHVRWSPGSECLATYTLQLDGGLRTMGAVSVSVDGVCSWLWTDDSELPGVGCAIDRSQMERWFTDVMGRRVTLQAIEPVRYRPRKRCVVRYRLDSGDMLFGKIVAGADVRSGAELLDSLGGDLVAALVAVAADWGLVVQRDVGRESLRDLLGRGVSPGVVSAFDSGGRLLARLHATRPAPANSRSLGQDASALEELLPYVNEVDAERAARYRHGVAVLGQLTDETRERVPSHGAFRADQVHVSDAGPRLIDLDKFCAAERERDPGNLVAYLEWRQLRGADTQSSIGRVRDAFLAGYARAAPLNPRRLDAYAGATMLKIAGRCCRNVRTSDWGHLDALLDEALARLDNAAGARA